VPPRHAKKLLLVKMGFFCPYISQRKVDEDIYYYSKLTLNLWLFLAWSSGIISDCGDRNYGLLDGIQRGKGLLNQA
jgi:hypothetical protein